MKILVCITHVPDTTTKISFTPDGKEYYEWSLLDGPADCSDHARGYASDLVQAFSKILEWRERIAADYNDLYNNDETN
jgi:electron transfer flavoprotein beta subunit